ncbi:hypothetical protein FD724_14665 [Nostoc sp. C057]|nr:hypothetical protein FD724_14665 [Nostoc sp. C057]
MPNSIYKSETVIVMLPLEPLFCPCCTPAILHLLTQSDLTQRLLQLKTGSVSAPIRKNQKQ